MQKKSKLFIANIVLGSVLGVLFFISIIFMLFFRLGFEEVERQYDDLGWDEFYQNYGYDYDNIFDYNYGYDYDNDFDYNYGYDYDDDYDYGYTSIYYTIPSITGASAELIGDTYQDREAREGYQYYKITMQVHNAGTDYMVVDYMDITVNGEDYEDVYLYQESFTDYFNDFAYSDLEVIPSCQTGTVSLVVEVKDTVEDVTIEIAGDNYTEGYASYGLNLK